MWQNWISGILGLWVILIAFLDFSMTLNKILLLLTGIAIAVFSFWMASLFKRPASRPESEIMPDISVSSDNSNGRDAPAGKLK